MDSLQNATVSSIESDTSSCSDCSLDEKPPNEFDCSLSDPIYPGNPCQGSESHNVDYNGVYDFVNKPQLSQNSSATSIVPNGIHIYTQMPINAFFSSTAFHQRTTTNYSGMRFTRVFYFFFQ
jgi:hypothetical protein